MGKIKNRRLPKSPIKPNTLGKKITAWLIGVTFSTTTLTLAYQFSNSNVPLSYLGPGADRAFAFEIQNQGLTTMEVSNFNLAPEKISLRTNKDLLLKFDQYGSPIGIVGEEEFFIEADALRKRLEGISLRPGDKLPLRIPPLIPSYGEKEKVTFSISYSYEPKISFLKFAYHFLESIKAANGKFDKHYLLEHGQVQEISREAAMGPIDTI